MECEGCGQFFEPGQNSDLIQGGCPNCGRPLRTTEGPAHTQFDTRIMENMPAPGESDMGGNPLKEGILADGGWKNRMKRDESFASVLSWNDEMKNRIQRGELPAGDGIHELCPHCRGEGCEACMGEGTQPIPVELTHDPQSPIMEQVMQQPHYQGSWDRTKLNQEVHMPWYAAEEKHPEVDFEVEDVETPDAKSVDDKELKKEIKKHDKTSGLLGDVWHGLKNTVSDPVNAVGDLAQGDVGGALNNVTDMATNSTASPIFWGKTAWQNPEEAALLAGGAALALPTGGASLEGAGAGIAAEEGGAAAAEGAAAGGEAASQAGNAKNAAGWLKGAMGKGKGAAGNYLKMKGVESELGQSPGGGAPAPGGEQMGSPDPRTFQQISHKTALDYESPSSHGEIPKGHEDSDPHQKADGDNKDWQKDFAEADEGGATQSPHQMQATFSPDTQAAYEMMFPLVHAYHNSDEDGSQDPLLQALHQVLDAEIPGFMDLAGGHDEGEHHPQDDYGNDNTEDAKKEQHTDNTDADEHRDSRVAFETPLVQETWRSGQPAGGQPPGVMPSPTSPIPQMAGPSPNASKCFNGHDVDPSSQACPQCGSPVMRPPGSPGADSPSLEHPQPPALVNEQTQQGLHTSSDHQGPHTPEQIAAVAKLLQDEGRGGEVPEMILQPWMYAQELAKVQDNPNVPNEGGTPPQPAQEEAPPEATMPMPGMQGQDPGMAMQSAINRYSADNVAQKCPKCDSHTTRLVTQDGDAHCQACGNHWKMKSVLKDDGKSSELSTTAGQGEEHGNPINVPAADQQGRPDINKEQDSSLSWKDDNGEPLHAGRTYELHSNNASFPDIVKVDEVKPDGVSISTVSEYGQAYKNEIYHEEAALNGYSFKPTSDGADQQTRDPGMEENNDYAPAMDTDGQVTDFSSPHQTQYASSAKPHLAWLDDDGSISRTAGRNYTPTEQRDFIHEQGVARNADKLNLVGTHYEEPTEDNFLW